VKIIFYAVAMRKLKVKKTKKAVNYVHVFLYVLKLYGVLHIKLPLENLCALLPHVDPAQKLLGPSLFLGWSFCVYFVLIVSLTF